MNRGLAWRNPVRLGLAGSFLVTLALLPSRLLGLHGLESAFVLGVVLPPLVCALAASATHRLRGRSEAPTLLTEALATTSRIALAVLAVPAVALALNALRVRQCDPAIGLAFFALLPGLGVMLAALTGVAVGATLPTRRSATLVAALIPIAALGQGLWVFWSSPAIFVYGPFAGWFPGTLYDEALSVPLALITYRLRTLLLVTAVGLSFGALWSPIHARLALARLRDHPALVSAALLVLLAYGTAATFAERLGHESSDAFIASKLGATLRGQRCTVHVPSELSRARQARLLWDCELRVEQSRRALGLARSAPVTAFFYRSADEKQRLMGAGLTFIAKPWRREVHLQLASWPHPVLHHEIVHAIASDTASGPFAVSGWFGGWLPNPGLIEGLAVAVAWDIQDGLTPHERARVLLDLGTMPPLDAVLGMGFLTRPAAQSYTIAGSFLRFLADERRVSLSTLYRMGDIEAVANASLPSLEAAWKTYLRTIEVDATSSALARLALERPSLFSAVCPRKLARLRGRLAREATTGDWPRVRSTCQEVLAIDALDGSTRALYVGALAASDPAAARAELDRLEAQYAPRAKVVTRNAATNDPVTSDPGAPSAPARATRAPSAASPYVAAARRRLLDALWTRGDLAEAQAELRQLESLPQDEDRARATEVRALALDADPESRRILWELLVGETGVGAEPVVVAHLAHELSARRTDGLGAYLEARQLFQQEAFARAEALLAIASERGLPTARLRHACEVMRAESLAATGRLAQAAALQASIEADTRRSPAARAIARDWLARLRLAEADDSLAAPTIR